MQIQSIFVFDYSNIGFSHDPIDRQLAHLPKHSVGRAHDRSSYMRQRVPMMQAFADYVDVINNNEITYKGIINYDRYDRLQRNTNYVDYPENFEHGGSFSSLGYISRSTLYRGIKTGIYPKSFKRSTKLNGWYADENCHVYNKVNITYTATSTLR